MCVYIYVCVYIYMCVCIYICVCVYIYIYILTEGLFDVTIGLQWDHSGTEACEPDGIYLLRKQTYRLKLKQTDLNLII